MAPVITRVQPDTEMNKLLLDTSTNILKLGFALIGPDNLCMPLRYEEIAKEIEQLEVFDDDIWVVSHPKCGTTWTQEMVWLIGHNFNYETTIEPLYNRYTFVELTSIFDYSIVTKKYPDFVPSSRIVDSILLTKNKPRPRYIKSHLPWSVMPKQIRECIKRPKIIYITRNPKDACTSFYHHCRVIEGYIGTFDQFCELFLAGKVLFGPYWSNVLHYWKLRNEPNILFLKYEDMKRNPSSGIKEIATFLGKEITEQEIEKLIQFTSFEEMKKKEGSTYLSAKSVNIQFYNKICSEGKFFRSGTIGSYKADMSLEYQEKFDKEIENIRKQTGLTF